MPGKHTPGPWTVTEDTENGHEVRYRVMQPKFSIGTTVALKDGRHRIPATVVQSYESWQGKWHGITYDLALHGKNEGQSAESVREDKLEVR